MKYPALYNRKLNDIETAFAIANTQYPLCVVCILHVSQSPDIAAWQQCIDALQKRHWLLRAQLIKQGGVFYFRESADYPAITVSAIARTNNESWREEAERLLNEHFAAEAPLMKVTAVFDSDATQSELIVAFHHAIVDGTYARLLLHEILSIAGLPDGMHDTGMVHTKPQFSKKRQEPFLSFARRKLSNEITYWKRGAKSSIPGDSTNATLNLQLTLTDSENLIAQTSRHGISLNSLLLAAMAQAVLNQYYTSSNPTLVRVISFADVRQLLIQNNNELYAGCLVSMLRSDITINTPQNLLRMASTIHKSLTRAALRGEPLTMFKLSKRLMQLTLRLKQQRLATVAISFLGPLHLQQQYGSVELKHVTSFITNNQLGPQLSAFSKILFGCISIDFTYLTAETSHEAAKSMVAAINIALGKFSKIN